ncbi:MAG: primosomal protein N' [bacterium]|nr:primosomal protein N' [Candidatus Colisoma equi]
MLAKVAIDLALDRLFTYEVPEALQKKLAVGQLLSVPFGRREARGFAMEVCGSETLPPQGVVTKRGGAVSAPQFKTKPVTAIVDETPFFSPALLELVKKVAAYTASPIEAVLKTALPAAVLKRNARAKEQLFVDCSIVRLEDCSIARKGLTQRQRWLVEQIERLGGGWMQQLCRELKTTPASIRALAEKGFVTVEARAKRRDPLAGRRILPTKPLPLNEEQRRALEAIESLGKRDVRGAGDESRAHAYPVPRVPHVLLLFGVTGSGKTEVYLQAIAAELAVGRGAIVMVPEIALTPQTVGRFASRFGDRVAVLHSALSDGERYDEWHRIRSGAARVVVGPRSAVWAPVRGLGLIVVDEEHETSYKQDEMPRYHARDVAVLRGAIEGAKVVLGSATPSLESWMNVKRGKYALAEMKCRAGAGTLPNIRIEDMRREAGDGGLIYSRELLDAIRLRLDRHEQTILFLNRRGYARAMTCGGCGHVMTCPDCGVPYTYHQADSCLRCHICGGWILPPKTCPECCCPGFDLKGVGTQRAEAALAKCFPQAKVLRMDADSTSRKNSHDDILSAIRRG